MFEYYAPYDIKPSPYGKAISSDTPSVSEPRERPVGLLKSIKALVHRPLSGSRPARRKQSSSEKSTEKSTFEPQDEPKQRHSSLPTPRIAFRLKGQRHTRQAHRISMAEYLTLEQLEKVWQQQDTRTEYIDRPWESRYNVLPPPTVRVPMLEHI